MKIFILLICFFTGLEKIKAQNNKIDSLNNLISKVSIDSERIKLVIKKIDVLSNINLDTAIVLGKKTLAYAQKINFYWGEIILRQKLAENFCYKGEYGHAEENLIILEHFLKSLKDSSNYAYLYSIWGMLYGMKSKYDSSIYFYEKAIGIVERLGLNKLMTHFYSNISIAYQQQSNFAQALFFQQKALQISEKNNDETQMAYTIMNMGNTYDNMGDASRAEKNYMKAIKLAIKKKLTNVELYSYSNLASLYVNQKKWQSVYEFAMKAATLGGTMGDKGIQAASMSKAATALVYLNKPSEAESMATKSIIIADSSAQPLNIYQANSSMGTILRLKRSYAKAIYFFEKAFFSLKGSDIYGEDFSITYHELSECYEKLGNYSKALENYKIAAKITDSARSKDNIKKATELTMNYEFDKKQQVQHAQQLAKDEVAGARQVALIVGLALTIVIAVVSFIGFRNKQKANILLEQQKGKVETTLTELKSTQSQLIQSEKMASLGELTAGIAHEIQNPLNFVNNFSEVNNELIDEMEEALKKDNKKEVIEIAQGIRDNLNKINHHGKRADAIVKGMLQHSRISNSVKESTDINALTDEYLRLAYHGLRAKDKSFNVILKTDLDESIGKIDIIPQDIGRVVLNLITNAFYAVAEKKKQNPDGYEPTVTVSTKKIDNKVLVSVKDNGNGIPQKVLDKIFQPFFTTKPTGKGTGLGLSISYDIVKAHRGELKVESKEGEGAAFMIILPSNQNAYT